MGWAYTPGEQQAAGSKQLAPKRKTAWNQKWYLTAPAPVLAQPRVAATTNGSTKVRVGTLALWTPVSAPGCLFCLVLGCFMLSVRPKIGSKCVSQSVSQN